jgi:hypothetical protein
MGSSPWFFDTASIAAHLTNGGPCLVIDARWILVSDSRWRGRCQRFCVSGVAGGHGHVVSRRPGKNTSNWLSASVHPWVEGPGLDSRFLPPFLARMLRTPR